ncbi:MAG: hypothetical protein IJ771_00045 [Clostridia bacterium]|nr:hypothetical protein [Clostridia bacterium]MBR1826096.1 hypothetical protein [Clostridia bacterium]
MAKKNQPKTNDAFVFVHGMLGFGEDEALYKVMPYWGGTSGSVVKRMREEGYDVCAPSFSGISSAWDRACELYAALTGTRVDYGVAHSKKYGHARYGITYPQARVPDWGKTLPNGEKKKVHIIGHSFGGATVRMLSHLMAYGSEEERAATPEGELSPLFAGGHGDWIKSVTTIAGPFNGTTVIRAIGILVPTLKVIAFWGAASIAGNTPFRKIYDMQLTQWKITSDRYGKIHPTRINRLGRIKKFWTSHDDCFWDLCLAGAHELNEFFESNPDAYQFAISTDASKRKRNGNYKMKLSTFFAFQITGNMMGRYHYDDTMGQELGEEWKASDGCSNTVSALHPDDEPWVDYKDSKDNLQKGIWNVMPVYQGDHGEVVGLGVRGIYNPGHTRKFFKNHIAILENLD